MKTFVQTGNTVTITTPAGGLTSGEGVQLGELFGVATHTAAAGAECEIQLRGVIEIAKTSALEISVGDALYWDSTNAVVNKTATNQKEVGVAVSDAANPSPTVQMLLIPTVRVDSTEGV